MTQNKFTQITLGIRDFGHVANERNKHNSPLREKVKGSFNRDAEIRGVMIEELKKTVFNCG